MGKQRAKNRPKRPQSGKNARSKAVTIRTGAGHNKRNQIMVARLDRRSRIGKAFAAELAALTQHLGGIDSLTAPQKALVEQASRLSLLEHVLWAEATKAKRLVSSHGIHPALDAYLRTARERRAVLLMLGIESKTKEISDLKDYIVAEYRHEKVW